MSLIGKIADGLISEITEDAGATGSKDSLKASNISVLLNGITDTVGAVASRIISDPKGTLDDLLEDAKVAVFGHNGAHPVTDAVNFAKGIATLNADVLVKAYNTLSPEATTPAFERTDGAISAQAGAVVENKFQTGASLGDLSWLIYKGRMISNTEITDKWRLYKEAETSHGFNSRIYVDEANKQVAITLEGTQSNSDLSALWLSKDGLADLEIGLGVIPPQMREGYEAFKVLVADVQNHVGGDYGISVAGHSLGGGLAQMMAGMYFIDTGVALPTLAEAGPGMLAQLKLYAQEQLLAGREIHLPSGGTVKLADGLLSDRAAEAKAVVSSFKAQDFSNVVNLITIGDPVGAVNYNVDPGQDGHVGVNFIVPYLLTTREDMQDVESVVMDPVNSLNLKTPSEWSDSAVLGGLADISLTRFDRHEPDQSIALWSGTAVGFKDKSLVGLGSAVYRSYLEPREMWSGSNLGLPELTMFGSEDGDLLQTSDRATLALASDGDDVILGGKGGNILSGGNGDDQIFGGDGDDYLAGDAGDDLLYGGKGNDILFGGAGSDYLDGGEGDDLLFGGAGDDILVWSKGDDILCGNEGNDTLIVKEHVAGNGQIKWERNFTNFGHDKVLFEGAMGADSRVLFNFADEIRFQDMKWSVNGQDIIMTDTLGNEPATVTFANAFESFGLNDGQIDFQFTNGSLYVDDVQYAVSAGSGEVKANGSDRYSGTFLAGSSSNDILYSGSGDDLMFGGAGSDTYVFDNAFGNDRIVGATKDDTIKFNQAFDSMEYLISQKGGDLMISYQQTGLTATHTLTVSDWYTSGDQVNTFSFSDATYKIEGAHFIKNS